MGTEKGGEEGRRFAIADACVRCKNQIVTMEKHYVTAHGALCQKSYPWYIGKWGEYRMAQKRPL